jgi:WD40 repeat protein
VGLDPGCGEFRRAAPGEKRDQRNDLQSIEAGSSHGLTCLCFAPTVGDKEPMLLAAGLDGTIMQLRLGSGEAVKVATVPGGPIWCMALQGSLLAVGSEDGSCRVFALSSAADSLVALDTKAAIRMDLCAVGSASDGRCVSLCWHPEGAALATGSDGGVIRVWDSRAVKGGGKVATLSSVHTIRVRGAVARSGPGGGRKDASVRVGAGSDGFGGCVVWSLWMDESWTMAAADSTGVVSLWNARDGTLMQFLRAHKGDAVHLAGMDSLVSVTTDKPQSLIVSSGVDGKICVLRPLSSAESALWGVVGEDHCHAVDVRALAVSPTGTVASGALDGTLHFAHISRLGKGNSRSAAVGDGWAAELKVAGGTVVPTDSKVGTKTGEAKSFASQAHRQQWLHLAANVRSVTASEDHHLAMVDPLHSLVQVWKLPEAAEASVTPGRPSLEWKLHLPKQAAPRAIALANDGSMAALVTTTGLVLLPLKRGAPPTIREVPGGEGADWVAVALSKERLTAVGCDGRVSSWLLADGEVTEESSIAPANESSSARGKRPRAEAERISGVHHPSVAFSPSGQFAAFASSDGQMVLTDTVAEKQWICPSPQATILAAAIAETGEGIPTLFVITAAGTLAGYSMASDTPEFEPWCAGGPVSLPKAVCRGLAERQTRLLVTKDEHLVLSTSSAVHALRITGGGGLKRAKTAVEEAGVQAKTLCRGDAVLGVFALSDGSLATAEVTREALLREAPAAVTTKRFGV